MSVVKLEDEDLVARSIQGCALPLPPIEIKPLIENKAFSTSSIDSVAPKFTPILSEPKQNIMLRALAAHDKTEELAEKSTQLFEKTATQAMHEISRLSEERDASFQREIEAAKNRDTWSTLTVVAQYIGSVSAVAFGATIMASGLWVPGLLLALGGVAGGAVRVLRDTDLLQPVIEWFTKSEELQKSIQEKIDTGALCLQIGLGLAGGYAAWQAGAFAAMQAASIASNLTQASGYLSAAGQVMNVSGQAGQMIHQKRMLDARAEGRQQDLKIFEERELINQKTKFIEEILRTEESQVQQIRKAIEGQQIEVG